MRCTDELLPEIHRQGLMTSEEEEGMQARKRGQSQVSVHCAGSGVRMGRIAGGVGARSPLSASVNKLPLLTGPRAGLGLSHLELSPLTSPVGALHREELPCLLLGPW